jgi:hypothetical protein
MEKLLILSFAVVTAVCWLRYGCCLILEASHGPIPPHLQEMLQRFPRSSEWSGIRPLLAVLRRECRKMAVEACPACGSRLGRGACDRAVLLFNFDCLSCCCFLVGSISPARSRGMIQEMTRIVSCLAQRDTAPLALQ